MNTLFKILRIFGDAKALSKGTYGKRVARRAISRPAHRAVNRSVRKIFK